jgi:hypothetical protein
MTYRTFILLKCLSPGDLEKSSITDQISFLMSWTHLEWVSSLVFVVQRLNQHIHAWIHRNMSVQVHLRPQHCHTLKPSAVVVFSL